MPLNIDLDEDDENMQYRGMDEDEIRSDFDEIKGLGRPSIDSFTMEEVSCDFNDSEDD